MSELYERMKAKGVDMSWYEKHKHIKSDSTAIPLDDEKCSNSSIYKLELDGSLWSINRQGEPHKQVRRGVKELPRSIYVCVKCKTQWDDPFDNEGMVSHDMIPIL